MLLGQLFPLPVAAPLDDLQGMGNVLFPACAKQGPAQAVRLVLDEQIVALHVAAAGAIDGDPVGELAALVVGGQGCDQFAIPEVGVTVVETVRTGATEVHSQNAHGGALPRVEVAAH
ncbi:hypothetical protein D3C78_897090 [compost metagenome]